jgi:hypothetical protein
MKNVIIYSISQMPLIIFFSGNGAFAGKINTYVHIKPLQLNAMVL